MVLLTAAGCSSHNTRSAAYLRPFERGEWARAAHAAAAVARDGSASSFVLDHLELGAVRLAAGEFADSDAAFSEAWTVLAPEDGSQARSVGDTLAAVALNDRVLPYVGSSYDRVMCATYQALDALAVADVQTARVMLKRAEFAQEDAERRFAKQISAAAETLAKDHATVNRVESSSAYKEGFDELYGTLEARFQPYQGWTNPFTDWLTAIVLLGLDETGSDRNHAIDLLRRVRGTIGPNAAVDADLARAERGPVSGVVWVMVESGLAPKRVERTFKIPAYIPEIPFVGLALPDLVAMPGGIDSFTLDGTPSSVVCDLGSIISHEFSVQLPLITRRAIASTLAKAAATLAANLAAKKSGNKWAQVFSILGTNLYGSLTLAADLRTWRTLPRRILIARSDIPTNRRILLGGLGEGMTIDLIDGEVVLVHVRSVEPSGRVAVFQSSLGSIR